MISLTTNVSSLVAQENLRVTTLLQNKAVEELTSGYRINSSGDDAAGLAVANQFRNDVAELTQGVRNANDGISQLQIVDGGLSNISRMLTRLKTLATQSASDTFTGDRGVLNEEYQQLLSEITRQAGNVGLNSGGTFNTTLSAYIGGGGTESSAASLIGIDLSGTANAVDASSFGLTGASRTTAAAGSSFTNNLVNNLNEVAALFNIGTFGSQTFVVKYVDSGGSLETLDLSIAGTAGGVSGAAFVQQINDALLAAGASGIAAEIGTSGDLQFSGSALLSVVAGTSGSAPSSPPVDNGATLLNGTNYRSTGHFVPFLPGDAGPTTETLELTLGGVTHSITLDSSTSGATAADTIDHAVASLNAQLSGTGVYATNFGNELTLQSANAFSLVETNNSPGVAIAGAPGGGYFAGPQFGVIWSSQIGSSPHSATVAFQPFTPGSNGGTETTQTFSLGIFWITLSSASSGNTAADTLTNAVASINTQLIAYGLDSTYGIHVIESGGNIVFLSDVPFNLIAWSYTAGTGGPGVAGSGSLFGDTSGSLSVIPPPAVPESARSAIDNAVDARSALTSIDAAIAALGRVQGIVGAGQNKFNYGISLAQWQISSFSAAESRIRDADIAAQAAILTRTHILQHASVAALAQANSSAQAVLQLLQ
jgi:flagellin